MESVLAPFQRVEALTEMATSPFGNFADLSRYQAAASAPVASPLESLIAGFTQGQAIRNIPQVLQAQRQAQLQDELSRRLNIALTQQKLSDLERLPEQRSLEDAIRNLSLQRQGVFRAPQVQGAGEVLPALPLDQRTLADIGIAPTTDQTPLVAEVLAPTPRAVTPQRIGQGIVFDPATASLNQMIEAAAKGRQRQLADAGKLTSVSPNERVFRQNETGELEEVISPTSKGENLVFRQSGNVVVGLNPATGEEVSRATIPANIASQKLDFQKQGTDIVGLDPVTGEEKSRIPAPNISGGKGLGKADEIIRKYSLQEGDRFSNDPAVRQYIEALGSVRTIQELGTDPNATALDDTALIFSFMKTLDPRSTVREGEAASVENARGIPESIRNLYNRAAAGNRLTPEQRLNLVKASKAALKGQRASYNVARKRTMKRIEAAGLDPDIVFGGEIDEEDTFGETPSTPSKTVPEIGFGKPVTTPSGTTIKRIQ